MKIIDNKKDYYDYLMGIYGQDEQIVFDRRGSQMVNAGYSIEHYCPNWRGGDKLCEYHLWVGNEYRIIRYVNNEWKCGTCKDFNDYLRPVQRKTDKPIELIIRCLPPRPWASYRTTERWSNPILRDLKIIRKFISADFIWNAVYDYIGKLKEKPIIDTRTDVQKAESHGFDKRTSFRNVK